jgi:hypothetical protein
MTIELIGLSDYVFAINSSISPIPHWPIFKVIRS